MWDEWAGLAGKVAVVTGGAGGLGRAATLALARAGMSVAVCDRDPDALAGIGPMLEAIGVPSHLATFDVRHIATINALYTLPFGHGQRYGNDVSGWTSNLIGGWSVSSIITAQSGFPFTPQLSYNPSNNGDTRNPVRPFANPDFTGSVVTGNPNQWFNPAAFIAPPTKLGFYGNLGRDTFTGPGLATWDFSVLKDTKLRERLNLQFRAELFNLLNRANFNTPNLITFTPSGVSGTAGAITSTSTTARQVQFALKLLW